jgi:hypothetical protein
MSLLHEGRRFAKNDVDTSSRREKVKHQKLSEMWVIEDEMNK